MQNMNRWKSLICLVGGALASTLMMSSAQALPEDQIVQRLQSMPVFALTDSQGAPLVATPENSTTPVAGIFISQRDAQAFLESLKTDNPQLAEGVRVASVSLADVYRLAQRGQGDEANPLNVAFIPIQQEVEAAKTQLQENGENAAEFRGTPLFVVRSGGAEEGYLTVQQDNRTVIPMFFDRDQLQSMLDRLQQVQPELAQTLSVQVVNLEGLIETLQTSDNQELNQILLVPPPETVQYIQSLQDATQQAAPQQR